MQAFTFAFTLYLLWQTFQNACFLKARHVHLELMFVFVFLFAFILEFPFAFICLCKRTWRPGRWEGRPTHCVLPDGLTYIWSHLLQVQPSVTFFNFDKNLCLSANDPWHRKEQKVWIFQGGFFLWYSWLICRNGRLGALQMGSVRKTELDDAGFDLTMELFSAFLPPRPSSPIQALHSTLWNGILANVFNWAFKIGDDRTVRSENLLTENGQITKTFERKFTTLNNLCNAPQSVPPTHLVQKQVGWRNWVQPRVSCLPWPCCSSSP